MYGIIYVYIKNLRNDYRLTSAFSCGYDGCVLGILGQEDSRGSFFVNIHKYLVHFLIRCMEKCRIYCVLEKKIINVKFTLKTDLKTVSEYILQYLQLLKKKLINI